MSVPYDVCLSEIRQLGFETVLDEITSCGTFKALFQYDMGLVVTTSSFMGRFNSLQLYANWVPTSWNEGYRFLNSGHVYSEKPVNDPDTTDWVWVGNEMVVDYREGWLKSRIAYGAQKGRFLRQWVESNVWFINGDEEKQMQQPGRLNLSKARDINLDKILSMPKRAQKLLNLNKMLTDKLSADSKKVLYP